MDSPATDSLLKATALTLAPALTPAQHHLKASHRSLAPTTRLVATHLMDNSPMVDHSRVATEVSSSKAPTADLLSNTVVMTKAATAALAALEGTDSRRADTASLRADTADSSLPGATEAVDTSSSMATAVTEGDLCHPVFTIWT